jgi:hypothetical protein
MSLKGFNALVGITSSGKKRGRVWAPSAERAAKHIEQIREASDTGEVPAGNGKVRQFSPRDLVDKVIAALKAGATPGQIREAAHAMLAKQDMEAWKAPKPRAALMDHAKEKGADLSLFAETFGLEEAGTVVVPSE